MTMNKNIWLCSDYRYHRYAKPVVLPSLLPERADKFRMYGMAGGMTIIAEHLLYHDSTPVYLAYEWSDWRGDERAYITFALEPNDMLSCGYYMRLTGMSATAWLAERLLYPLDGAVIGMHRPEPRDGAQLWSHNPSLDGIL